MNAVAQSSLSRAVFQDEVAATPALASPSSTSFPQHRVNIGTETSSWMRDLESRFNEVVSLPIGWDGYGGVPVSFTTAQFAAQMIERLCVANVPAPSIVPGSDGSLQIEWHSGGFDIELDVQEPLKVEAYRLNQETNDAEELDIESDFRRIAIWISDVARVRAEAKKDQTVG